MEERVWMENILWKPSPNSNSIMKKSLLCWKNRMSTEDLRTWRNNSRVSTVLFDGASKGNPGIVGAG